jgi:hypothetical protein
MQAFSPLVHDTIRVLLVMVHLVAVAVAVGLVFWQDIALLTSRRINSMQFRLSSIRVTQALIVLWLSGLAMIGLDTGFDIGVLAAKPKIQAKLLVVTLLSLNGWALHRIAFPALMGMHKNSARTATLVAVLGAISTASWVYAIFLGVARPLAQSLGFAGFIGLYGALLLMGMAVALLFVRPHIETLLLRPAGFTAGQIIAILLGLGRAERAGALHRHKSLGRHVMQVAIEARRHGPQRRSA